MAKPVILCQFLCLFLVFMVFCGSCFYKFSCSVPLCGLLSSYQSLFTDACSIRATEPVLYF